MLYQMYETQRALMSPFSEFASASAKLYDHPLSPFAHTPMAQRVSAGFDLLHRLAKEYEKPPFNITAANINGVTIAVQEQVAVSKPWASPSFESVTMSTVKPSVWTRWCKAEATDSSSSMIRIFAMTVSRSLVRGGQGDAENGSVPQLGFEVQRAFVLVDDLGGNGQSKTGTIVLRAEERVK